MVVFFLRALQGIVLTDAYSMAWEVYSLHRVKIWKALTSPTRALTVTVCHRRIMKPMSLSYFLILSGGRIFMYLFHIFSSLSFYNGFDMLLATQDALVMNERSCFFVLPRLVPLVLHEVRTGVTGRSFFLCTFKDHRLRQLASCNLAHCLLLHGASLGGVALFWMGPKYHTAYPHSIVAHAFDTLKELKASKNSRKKSDLHAHFIKLRLFSTDTNFPVKL